MQDILFFIVTFVGLTLLWLGAYAVRFDQLGFVFRLGQPHRVLLPGWHFILPAIDKVLVLEKGSRGRVDAQNQIQIGPYRIPAQTGDLPDGTAVMIDRFEQRDIIIKELP